MEGKHTKGKNFGKEKKKIQRTKHTKIQSKKYPPKKTLERKKTRTKMRIFGTDAFSGPCRDKLLLREAGKSEPGRHRVRHHAPALHRTRCTSGQGPRGEVAPRLCGPSPLRSVCSLFFSGRPCKHRSPNPIVLLLASSRYSCGWVQATEIYLSIYPYGCRSGSVRRLVACHLSGRGTGCAMGAACF